jgi:hypothetical protein
MSQSIDVTEAFAGVSALSLARVSALVLARASAFSISQRFDHIWDMRLKINIHFSINISNQ